MLVLGGLGGRIREIGVVRGWSGKGDEGCVGGRVEYSVVGWFDRLFI